MNMLAGRLDRAGGRIHLSGIDAGIVLPRAMTGPASGEGVLVGVRPQDLVVLSDGMSADRDGLAVEGRVSVVEPLGSETFVHIESGSETLIAVASGRNAPRAGTAVRAGAARETLKFFDAGSEASLLA